MVIYRVSNVYLLCIYRICNVVGRGRGGFLFKFRAMFICQIHFDFQEFDTCPSVHCTL